MITVLLSGVFSFVEKIKISSTIPATPPTSTKSPALNGLKVISNTPDAKLDNEPCSAKPTAKPAAPNTAIKLVVSIPTWLATATKSTTFNKTPITLIKKGFKLESTPFINEYGWINGPGITWFSIFIFIGPNIVKYVNIFNEFTVFELYIIIILDWLLYYLIWYNYI